MDPAARHSRFSLPDRKRGADSARLSIHDNQAKVPRISPLFEDDIASDPVASNDTYHGPIDYIDLTGQVAI